MLTSGETPRRDSPRRRLISFSLLALVLAGIFGMHVLSGSAGHGGHDTRSSAVLIASDHKAASAGMDSDVVMAAGAHTSGTMAAPGDAQCPGSCEDPAPGHIVLMVGCVLALLGARVRIGWRGARR